MHRRPDGLFNNRSVSLTLTWLVPLFFFPSKMMDREAFCVIYTCQTVSNGVKRCQIVWNVKKTLLYAAFSNYTMRLIITNVLIKRINKPEILVIDYSY
jgi:hypothetical protein